MNAKEYLNIALGGNMNFGTLKPLAIEEIMEGYAVHKFNVLNQYKIDREKCIDCDELQEKKPKYAFCVYCDRSFD